MSGPGLLHSRWLRPLLTFIIAVPACGLAYWAGVELGPSQISGRQPPPAIDHQINGLFVAPTELDFGETWEDPEFVRTITVRNSNSHSVRVTDMHGGCECTSVEPRAFTIAAGGSQQVSVKIDLTHRYPYQFGVDRREVKVSVHPAFEGRGLAADGWVVSGVVKSRVSVDGRELAFADLCGQGDTVTRAMKATAHVALAKLEAAAPPEKATVSVLAAPKRPGGYDVRVTPNPDLPLGPFTFDVALTATTPDGAKHRCVAFRVTGEMCSPARVVPDPVLLGEHPIGSSPEATVSVKLPANWSVDRIETELATTVVTRGPPLDDLPTYRIVQPISKPGDGTCQVRFVCRKPNGQLETVPAKITWYGGPATKGKKP